MINLTFAIPTVVGREQQFEKFYSFVENQIKSNKLEKKVQLLSLCDNKEISIGAKRQQFIEMAKGKFIVMQDDDDWIEDNYIKTINDIIEDDPSIDSIGYFEMISGFGNKSLSCISNIWSEWSDNRVYNGKMFRFVRSPFYKVPILTEYYKIIGINDIRFGEDQDFSNRLKNSELIQNEYLLERVMIYYQYKKDPLGHDKKYGITK